jgi:hypothetical protein
MRRFAASIGILFLIGCSAPVRFLVTIDEPADRAELVLDDYPMEMRPIPSGQYEAVWEGGDSSGYIEVLYPDGATVRCSIGYATIGMEDQVFEIRDRSCSAAGD